MLILALDTSTPAVTAGVVELPADGRPEVRAERVTVNPRAHGELLMPHATEAVRDAGVSLAKLDAVVVGAGPGPFTGLRAGLVTAAALAQALDIPAHPVCGLDAIAAEVRGEPLLVVTDARRREVYWATYDAEGRRTAGPEVGQPSEVEADGATRVAGHGVQAYPEAFTLPAAGPLYPTPRGLALAAAGALTSGDEPKPLTPLYLRRPDAEVPGERKRVLS